MHLLTAVVCAPLGICRSFDILNTVLTQPRVSHTLTHTFSTLLTAPPPLSHPARVEKRSYNSNRLPWKENSSVGPTFSFTTPPLLLLPLTYHCCPFPSTGTKQEMNTQQETLLSVEEQLHDLGGRG